MGTTEKKQTGAKASSQRGGGSGRKKDGKDTTQQTWTSKLLKCLWRKEVGSILCCFLGLFSFFGYFDVLSEGKRAFFVGILRVLLKGLFGYGFWLAPVAFWLASFFLIFHRGRPVMGKTCCTLLIPVVVSSMVHSILVRGISWKLSLFSSLWISGTQLKSGGVISGLLAQSLVQIVGVWGALAVLLVLLIWMLLVILDMRFVEAVDWIRLHPRFQREEVPEPKERQSPVPQQQKRWGGIPKGPSGLSREGTSKSAIDIPMDGEEPEKGTPRVSQASQDELFQPMKGELFQKTSRVPPPDVVLRETGEKKTAVSPLKRGRRNAKVPEPVPNTPLEDSVQESQGRRMPEIQREPAVIPPEPEIEREPQRQRESVASDTSAPKGYPYPPLTLLSQPTGEDREEGITEMGANQQRLSDTLRSFGIDATLVHVTRGPSITRYELELDQGVRLNKLTNLSEDIALSLGATGVRIAPIPNKVAMVGIEVPNRLVSPVSIYQVLSSRAFQDSDSYVTFALGKDIGGNCVVSDLAKLPHLLIAGTTGSGKSVCTNTLIISMLYKARPEDVRLVMIDPKMVELSIYNGIPHLLTPVVTDPKKAAGALQWAVTEMMKRYQQFAEVGVRDLASFRGLKQEQGEPSEMPHIVVVIDELADLMMVAAKEVEEAICRVAQMGRASGIHLVIATQRPSADVITGLMKANIPSRISFAVASAMESRIILDTQGAEKLVGRGDMLYAPIGNGKPMRIQGCLISHQEVSRVVQFIKENAHTAQYDQQILREMEQNSLEKPKGWRSGPSQEEEGQDELFPMAVEVVLEMGQASVSMIQRRMKLGYARAARLIDQMEEEGIVGPFEGAKARQLLITPQQWKERMHSGEDSQEGASSDLEDSIL